EMLARRFAQMDIDHPRRVAHKVAAAFGGRETQGTETRSSELLDETFTDAERARWVELFVRAADDVRLPADPQFRSALLSYLRFTASVRESTSPSATRWDWGPGGAPPWPPEHVDETSTVAEVTLPTQDELVSFDGHIKPLFRAKDQQSMRF